MTKSETAPDMAGPAGKPGKKEKMYDVKFHSQEGPGGKDDIVVHVGNAKDIGRNWQIPREVKVTLPERVMNVIQNAKFTTWTTDEHTKEPVSREVDRFAYTIIRVEG